MNAADHAEFATYVREKSPALKRTAYLLTGDQHRAEDLVQSALVATMASWEGLRDRARIDAYVRQVMLNEQRSWWRRRVNREYPAADLPEGVQSDTSGRVDEHDLLLTALRSLPARQRATIVLRYFDDYSETATAALLGCSTGTGKSQTAKALAKLRVALAPPALSRGALPKGARHVPDRD